MSSKSDTVLKGLAVSDGLAAGRVFVYRGDGELPVPEYIVEKGREEDELSRYHAALGKIERDLHSLIAVLKERTGRPDIRVFECHLMILEDEVLQNEIRGYVHNEGLNIECAIKKALGNARAMFGRMNDPYFRERVRDIDDVERRILKELTGYDRKPHLELKEPSIVVADDLTPSETVQLPREFVLGFATDGGSVTSHVALLARALGIPAVCGLGNATSSVKPGGLALLDGTAGTLTVDPDEKSLLEFSAASGRRDASKSSVSAEDAGKLKDGSRVLLYANVHPGVPLSGIKEYGAKGVGLYRSEYLWLNREIEPSEDEQFEAYKEVASFADGLSPEAIATIRVLDIGGDKLVRGISAKEANPYLGNRSIRYLLSHKNVFRRQLRAILRASAFGKIAIMYPMVSCVEEILESAEILKSVKEELSSQNIAFDHSIPVGVMIEIPSAALNADEFSKYVDFFSIGTNDLVQYTMAADRGNDSVSHLYQPLNPAVVKLMKMTVDAARRAGKTVAVCGESAADPVLGPYWVAIGVDILSMSASYIPVVSKVLFSLSRADLDEYAKVPASLPAGTKAADIYNACREWMKSRLPGEDGVFG